MPSQSPSEQLDALIARLPAIARSHPEPADFWRIVDAEMEPITAAVETDDDQRALDERYHDLITEADVMGMVTPD